MSRRRVGEGGTLASPRTTKWIACTLFLAALSGYLRWRGDLDAHRLAGMLFQFALGTGALAIVSWEVPSASWKPDAARNALGLVSSRLSPGRHLASILLCLFAILAFSFWAVAEPEGAPLAPFAREDSRASFFAHSVRVLGVVLFPAFFEEIFFRGALQRALARRARSWIAILIGSILFAFAHLEAGPQACSFAFAMGLALGTLADRSASIFGPMLVHALNNAAFLSFRMGLN